MAITMMPPHVFAGLMQGNRVESERPAKNIGIPEAQRMELQGRIARYGTDDGWRPGPGEPVVEKEGLQIFGNERGLVFVRMLDPSDYADRKMIKRALKFHHNRVNCLLAILNNEGEVAFVPFDLGRIRKGD